MTATSSACLGTFPGCVPVVEAQACGCLQSTSACAKVLNGTGPRNAYACAAAAEIWHEYDLSTGRSFAFA